jgi:hypothetical protein
LKQVEVVSVAIFLAVISILYFISKIYKKKS